MLCGAAAGEQASAPASPAAGELDAGGLHSCAVLGAGGVRCWGYGASGQLGYGSTDTVGDDETPASVGPVSLGGHAVRAIAAGDFHTCALLDDGTVRCWGFGGDGRLGYGNTNNVLDPSTVGAVDLGPGRTAVAITAGAAHTCAILDDGSVRCWGYGGAGFPRGDGRLGYGNTDNVGDDETPGSVAAVNLGAGRTAVAISAGGAHTCAILDHGSVRCWGRNDSGQLGYGNTNDIGATPTTTPDTAGPVNLGLGRTAVAISAGGAHTCAVLDHGSVRCWGDGGAGQLGYGNRNSIGATATTTPDTAGPVNLGAARSAVAISAGDLHTCAVLDDGSVRCWGLGAGGRLGYGNQSNLGDTPTTTPDLNGPVDLGAGRTATAVSAGKDHTCARLDDGSVRCWGYGANGRLGYCSLDSVGDDELPGSVGPVNLFAGDGGALCPVPVNVSEPSISGQAVRGQTLTEVHGSWSNGPTGYEYQWERCDSAGNACSIIPGATAQTYIPTALDVGATIRVEEAASNTGGASVPASSTQTAVVTGAPASTSPPSISGRAVQFQRLTEAHGTWSNSPTGYQYQWQRCDRSGSACSAISRATGQTYTLTGADVAHTIRVQETASNTAGEAGLAVSKQTRVVRPADAARARGFRTCQAAVYARARRERALTRRGSARERARARRRLANDLGSGRRRCTARFGRTPGRVTQLRVLTRGKTRLELDFIAVGTNSDHPPAAQSYLIKQSLRPIRNQRDFARAHALCGGICHFTVQVGGSGGAHGGGGGSSGGGCVAGTAQSGFAAKASATGDIQVGMCISLTITNLKSHTTYYYAIAALDNITSRRGPRSSTVGTRTA